MISTTANGGIHVVLLVVTLYGVHVDFMNGYVADAFALCDI